jgi:hypothetical protein
MQALAFPAPVGLAAMLLDAYRFLDDLDLLNQERCGWGLAKRATAVGALVERVGMNRRDFFGRKERTFVTRMPRLAPAPPLLGFATPTAFGRLDNITGGRFGRIP